MKRKPAFAPLQSGVTLIELMVSLTIGLIIMLAVISAYLGASGASRTAEAVGRMNEDAQMALTILSQQLRMAGVNPSQTDRSTVTVGLNPRNNSVPLHNTVTNAYAIRGCDVKFSNVTSAASTSALTCGHSASSTGPDSIAIGYEADKYNTIPTGAGVPTDCMGTGITAMSPAPVYTRSDGTTTFSATIYEAENRFYVGTSTSVINPTLYCKGNFSANGQPLIENIEDLQFSYGTTNPGTTPTLVLGYLSAYDVDNDATTLTGSAGSASRWNAVKTVRICVVARSENPVLDTIASAKYLNCQGTLVTSPPDKRLRRAYTTTVVLRNN
jgi:type IV pilus assembly protein PilW